MGGDDCILTDMPSKKKQKAKGKARGAAKSRKKDLSNDSAVNEVTQDEDALLEEAINLAAAERERLEVSAKNDEENNEERCNHGFSPWPRGHICGRFIPSLLHGFTSSNGHSNLDRFMSAYKATSTKYEAVWSNPDMLEHVVAYYLAEGTSAILEEKDDLARQSGMLAIGLEQFRETLMGNIDAQRSYGKIFAFSSDTCDDHTLVSFFRKRIPCKCLDKRYKEVKSIVKMGLCMNLDCPLPYGQTERSKMLYCEQCRYMQYCSTECQKADWPEHKETCNASATRARARTS